MKIIVFIISSLLFIGCDTLHKSKTSSNMKSDGILTEKLSTESIKIRNYLSNDIVIAHRGSTYWTPESTEPAYRWARNIGADYLELDLQMTKDSILVAMHDETLVRISNVIEIYPEVLKPTTNHFTLKELRTLDLGSWFNQSYPDRARKSFAGTKILTLEDVIMIAEGYWLKKEKGEPVKEMIDNVWTGKYEYEKDPQDNLHRPGIYAETKKLHLEKLLLAELKAYRWLITDNPKKIKTFKNKVDIGNSNARFVLQSFFRESIEELNNYLPGVPKCLLIWESKMNDDLKNNYIETIDYCINNNVEIMGTSISGAPNNYGELTAPWMVDLIHESGMIIHPYTFDSNLDLEKYAEQVDGVFTNRTDLALAFFGRLKNKDSDELLKELGY